jgi:hypothetical protein
MALINKEEKEKRSVIIAVVAMSLIIFAFLWRFVFPQTSYDYVPMARVKIAPNIDFDYLKSSEFGYFQEYKQIEPLEEGLMGRDNPFLSY